MNIIEYADRDMLALDLAGRLASELNEALHHEDRVSLVVPGGTSPGPVFDDLCGAEVAWDRVHVALSDERWVPETSDRSNTRLIKDRLLTGPAAAAHLVPLYADGDIETQLPKLAAGIDVLRPITVLLLGMGTDMHTASIFPEADNLNLALHLMPKSGSNACTWCARTPRDPACACVGRGDQQTHPNFWR